jgi:hypothetical protein
VLFFSLIRVTEVKLVFAHCVLLAPELRGTVRLVADVYNYGVTEHTDAKPKKQAEEMCLIEFLRHILSRSIFNLPYKYKRIVNNLCSAAR